MVETDIIIALDELEDRLHGEAPCDFVADADLLEVMRKAAYHMACMIAEMEALTK